MIQRQQTLFLLAAALLCALSFLFPIAHYVGTASAPAAYDLGTMGLRDAASGTPIVDAELKYPIYVVYLILGVALLVDIFLFKNRKRQLTILRSAYVFGGLLVVLQLVTDQSAFAYVSQGRIMARAYGISMFLPLLILLLMFLADRAIRKDEELVKSMDRLR